MKKLVLMSLVFTLVLVVLSIKGFCVDNSANLANLQPLTSGEQAMYEKVKNDLVALHQFIVTRTYVRKIDQFCPDTTKRCG
jgi:uncharacterized secreted protein with C-terminal beta-propeller domain